MRFPDILTIAFVLLSGCGVQSGHRERIYYHDRNADGKADLETHRHPGRADADWALQDNDFDGRYEKKVMYGVGVKESSIDRPVPTDVRLKQ